MTANFISQLSLIFLNIKINNNKYKTYKQWRISVSLWTQGCKLSLENLKLVELFSFHLLIQENLFLKTTIV